MVCLEGQIQQFASVNQTFLNQTFLQKSQKKLQEYNYIAKNEKRRDTGFHLKYPLQSCKTVLQPLEREIRKEV